MRKNTGTRTATTHTLLLGFAPEDREGLTGTYVWPTEQAAREVIRVMVEINGFEHTEHHVPGLEVHAFYVNGELATVIEISDDTAARLHTAVRKARPVTVTYTRADGTETVRTIEPRDVVATTAGNLIVRGTDRESEGTRSFRLDRISAYTVHRTSFIVRMDTPAPAKADLVQAFRTRPVSPGRPGRETFAILPRRVRSTEGFTGRTSPSTLVSGPSGWSVKILLDDGFTHLTSTGTVRASLDDLVLL